MRVSENMIGGAVVMRPFNRGAERVSQGAKLTREEVLAIPPANRHSLIENGNLSVYPPGDGAMAEQQDGGALMIYSRGFGKFDVVRGTKVNEEPLSKEEAEALVLTLQPTAQPQTPADEPQIN